MSGIKGAAANQAKKQTKNAIQVMWNAFICTVAKLNKSMRVAFGSVALMAGEEKSMANSWIPPVGIVTEGKFQLVRSF